MSKETVRLFVGASGHDEASELATAHALLRQASAGELSEAIHIYRPLAPAVVFGRRDTRLPGFASAAHAASDAGFEIAVRAVGGRAVAYTSNALIIDHVRHEPDAALTMETRFINYGQAFAEALRPLGIDARVGAVPGEYCPGAHSVNARGVAKLIGTAQRVVRNAWLFSTLVTLDDHHLTQPILQEVYSHLGLEFDPASVGSVRGEQPDVDLARVEDAFLAAYALTPATATSLGMATTSVRDELVSQHRLV